MAKTIFHPNEVTKGVRSVTLQRLHTYEMRPVQEPLNPVDEIPEFHGPTADDLMREAELFRAQWEIEKARMIEEATADADAIRKQATEEAEQTANANTANAEAALSEARSQAESIVAEAKDKADALVQEAEAKKEELETAANSAGFDKGREAGYTEGKAEADRLVERVHTILERTYQKRDEILVDTEQQLVELVLLISRKVIKVISESQAEVVKANVIEALQKLKNRGDVTVRVNLADAKLTTEHTKDFIQAVENAQSITVLEDSTVDHGGCIVETDFGAIDARISSQLSELEKKIREVTPIRVTTQATEKK
jgi:flagellar assembly protein FliH